MKSVSNRPIVIHLPSSPSYLPVMRAMLGKLCELVGFDRETAGAVILSVDEALTNIIKHAYGGAEDGVIDIELAPVGETEPEAVKISLRDYGPGVDLKKIKSRDLDDVRPGGLGVHIIKKCMDTVEYAPADGGGTLLTMVKKLNSQKEKDKV